MIREPLKRRIMSMRESNIGFILFYYRFKLDNMRLKFLIRLQRFRQLYLQLRILRLECLDEFFCFGLKSYPRFIHGLRLLLFPTPNAESEVSE